MHYSVRSLAHEGDPASVIVVALGEWAKEIGADYAATLRHLAERATAELEGPSAR